ncbi:MAG: serine protease, partial [Shewanella sp.]
NNKGINVQFFDIPEGTKRVVWEQVSEQKGMVTSLDIGMDLNNNGLVEWFDEAICYSFTDVQEYCAINDPVPGRYWVMVGNYQRNHYDEPDIAKEVVTSLAIIGDADSNNLKVTGPQTTDGLTPYQLQMDWKVADAKKGDRFYAQVEVGNSADNIGNIGKMAVNLVHTGDDMVLAANKSQAAEGDIVTFSVDMAPNTLGLERSVNMALTLPEGLQLLKDSIKIASNNHDLKDQLVIAGQKLSLSTTQMASNAQKREYKYTTSDDDLSCRIPIGSNPYYLDLFTEAGIEPIPSIQGQANQGVILPLSAFGVDRIPLYNNDPAYMESNTLSISPGGFIQLDSTPLFWPAHYPMEASFFPDTVIAPFWRGDGFILPEFNTETESFDGVSVATTSDRRYLIVEWDNMRQEFAFGINFEPDPNARYSFELLASTELDFAPGEHEIIFAYDKLTGSKGHLGSIGTHGFHGPRGTFGPSYGYIGDSFAFNDIDQKVKEGLVVCGNYFGPEQSAITMTFDARVSAKAVGQTLKLEINSDYTGSNSVTSYTELKVPSNLSISSLPDMQTAENKALSFEVMVRDNQNSANGIEVIGKNITTVVKGNKVTLTPEANWHGETKVSVKVYDLAFNNDAVSTSFNLKVISDGVEPIPPTPEPEPEANRDGGSLGGGLLMLLGLGAAIRRRSSHKKYHS